ncbi:hypothetical protein G3N95_28280 [Paraburkholderia sp. Tr-20389]|uniref:hypothetical protein n=1 Tax=Paraburkholderia sp. Tr-20389 TaxID=2703903 RepID=UPI001980046F|nr:hypothetical protein [Paraburkholderia sp. Tr-20389]MBN3756868.1 hypothetical protein [Paraburkholderia sp. Tr-20389]
MLSPHELATLMLLSSSERRIESLDPDVMALRRYELVEVHELHGGVAALQISARGRALLKRLGMDAAR